MIVCHLRRLPNSVRYFLRALTCNFTKLRSPAMLAYMIMHNQRPNGSCFGTFLQRTRAPSLMTRRGQAPGPSPRPSRLAPETGLPGRSDRARRRARVALTPSPSPSLPRPTYLLTRRRCSQARRTKAPDHADFLGRSWTASTQSGLLVTRRASGALSTCNRFPQQTYSIALIRLRLLMSTFSRCLGRCNSRCARIAPV